MSGRSARYSAVVLLTLGLVLGACGRKGELYPPEGQEDVYTGLGIYPAPDSVVPRWGDSAAEPAGETASEEAPAMAPAAGEDSEEGAKIP